MNRAGQVLDLPDQQTRAMTAVANPLVCVMDYRLGPFGWMRLQAASSKGLVLGLEMSAETSDYAWDKVQAKGDFNRVTLFPEKECNAAPISEIICRLHAALDQHRPATVAIFGWSFNWSLAALLWCLKNQVPAIVLSDSTIRSNSRQWWKETLKRRIVSLFSAGLVAGTPQIDYLATLGMPRERIFTGWDVVDNEHFVRGAALARQNGSDLRVQLGLPENYFLAVNRFIEVKNLQRLIEAYARYRDAAGARAWKLVLIGDGPLMPKVQQWREHYRLSDDLVLPGFKQHPELPSYYGLAKAFVLASTSETWGLVVNEALASGLPALVSDHCGCVEDLIDHGRNGFRFDPLDVVNLSQLMRRLASPETDLDAMGRASREIIAKWSPDAWADNLQLASRAAHACPPRRLNPVNQLLLQLLIHR